ncbi:hypothetical protein [Actinoplanes sp. HUAS TT8]|uniref:hypothetical protein n=1 Tax=Actinoplanes sp. HUAS TT8 TaxID=3447453 RepID=UPI003F524765
MSARPASGHLSPAPALPSSPWQESDASTPSTTAPASFGPPITHADFRPVPVPHSAPFDLAHLSIWELRVAIYASGYVRYYDDVMSTTNGISRLVHTVTPVARQIGRDTLRAVADVIEYAALRGDKETITRFCPDSVRWDFTEPAARVVRLYATRHHFDPLTVDTLADQFGTQAVA